MIRLVAILVFLIPSAVLANCEGENALRQLVSKDPAEMAKIAVARSDLKFLGVAGYSVAVPGVDSKKCTARRDMVRVLEGTSDVPCDARLQDSARVFASSYNSIIKAQLDATRTKYEMCAP